MILAISDLNGNIDRVKKVHLLIASENTWQGIVIPSWPYEKAPPIITSNSVLNTMTMAIIDLSENIFKNRNGDTDYMKCFNAKSDNKCTSIFDTSFKKHLNR